MRIAVAAFSTVISALHAEGQRGVIASGALADLAVWSADLYEYQNDPAALLEQRADLTIVGGGIAYSSGAIIDADCAAPRRGRRAEDRVIDPGASTVAKRRTGDTDRCAHAHNEAVHG